MSKLAHSSDYMDTLPERHDPVSTCSTCDGHGLALNVIGEPDTCPECKGNGVVIEGVI